MYEFEQKYTIVRCNFRSYLHVLATTLDFDIVLTQAALLIVYISLVNISTFCEVRYHKIYMLI